MAEGGLLGLTQQMDSFHQLGSPSHSYYKPSEQPFNPFASSTSSSSLKFKPEESVDMINGAKGESYIDWSEGIDFSSIQLNQNGVSKNHREFKDSRLEQLKSLERFDNQPEAKCVQNHLVKTDSMNRAALYEKLSHHPLATQSAPRINLENNQTNDETNLPPTPPPSEDMMI